MDPATGTRPALPRLPPRVVFFDGVCGFCDRTVRMLLAADTDRRLHFAMLQGATAAALRERYPDRFPHDIDTLVYVDSTTATGTGPRILLRSEASFAIAREVPALRRWAWLSLLPRWLTDLGYRALAAVRYRLFGRFDDCRIPTPAERSRFVD